MSSPPAFPLLSLLVLVPAIGGLLVSVAGEKRTLLADRIGLTASGITLLLAGWTTLLVASTSGGIWEYRSWIVSLGVSYILGIDGLSSVLACWVALLTLLALLSRESRDPHTAALVLLSEAMSLGLFLARDVFLLFAFYAGAVVMLTLLTRARRKVFIFQMAGLVFLSGFFIRCYQMVFAQTGFASTELLRWRTLVLYPDAELSLLAIAFAGVAFVLPLFPVAGWLHDALKAMPLARRLVFFGSFSLTGSYLLFRVVLPLFPRGAMASTGWLLACAVLSLVYAALLPGPARERLIVGFQALVLVPLLSVHEVGVLGAALQMTSVALGMAGLAIGGSRVFSVLFALFLAGTPIAYVLPTLGDHSWLSAILVSAAFALFALRLVREVVRLEPTPATRRELVLAVPLAACCLSIVLAPGLWRDHLLPSARDFLGTPSAGASRP